MTKALLVTLAALGILLGSFLQSLKTNPVLSAAALQTYDAVNATTTLVTISPSTTTSTLRLGPTSGTFIAPVGSSTDNINRKFASLQNVGNATVYCGYQNSASVGSSTITSSTYGFILNASTSPASRWSAQEAGSLYVGQVWCAAGSATATIAVEEAN